MEKFLPLKLLFTFILILPVPIAFGFDVNSPITLYIDSFRQPCPENANQYCLRFRENENSPWLPLTLPIENFGHEEGVSYELLVYEDLLNETLVLIEILSQEIIPTLKPQKNLVSEVKIEPIQVNDESENISGKTIAEKPEGNSSANEDDVEATRQVTSSATSILSDEGFVLTGAQWQLSNIDLEGKLVSPIEKSKYTLNLKPDGSLTVVADCYRGSGNYAFNSEKITFNINYSNDPCDAESIAEAYRAGLEQSSSYLIEDNKLHFYGESNLITFTAIPISETPIAEIPENLGESSPNLEPTLENNLWLLSNIDKGDRIQGVQGIYSIRLSQDGSLEVNTDCYQGKGTYSLEGSVISFEFPIEHKTCTPELFVTEEFAEGLKDAEVYSLQGGKLYVRIASSGDVMVFTQSDEIEETIPTSTEPPIKGNKLKTIKIEALAIRSSVPIDWPIVNRHPFFNNIWAKGPFNYVSFVVSKGANDLEALKQNLELSATVLAEKASIETFGQYRWRLYLDEGPIVNLAVATTIEGDSVYTIIITGTKDNFSEILRGALESFEVLE